MTEGRTAQGLQHRGMGIGGTWSQQQSLRGGDASQMQAVRLIHGLDGGGERGEGHAVSRRLANKDRDRPSQADDTDGGQSPGDVFKRCPHGTHVAEALGLQQLLQHIGHEQDGP